jgi:hypothetical protein
MLRTLEDEAPTALEFVYFCEKTLGTCVSSFSGFNANPEETAGLCRIQFMGRDVDFGVKRDDEDGYVAGIGIIRKSACCRRS